MDDVLKALGEAGFTPVANNDEDFPPLKGEYAATCTVLRPFEDKETGEKTAYLANFKIGQTLSGDPADGRVLSRFYRIAGKDFQGNPINGEATREAIKQLCNDAFTAGVQLDLGSTAAFEGSFAMMIDRPCFVRAWHFSPKDEPERKIQQFVIKQEKQLRKGSKEGAAGRTDRAPF